MEKEYCRCGKSENLLPNLYNEQLCKKHYHEDYFLLKKCTFCNTGDPIEDIIIENNLPYCSECYEGSFICEQCGERVANDNLN